MRRTSRRSSSFAAALATRRGISGDILLEEYPVLYERRVTVLSEVVTCKMPKPPAEQPTDAEKKTLLDWLACEAPNN